jgi:type VI secretion system protein ImpB
MAGRESIHKKLSRVRPPRVQISYEVEVGNAIQLKELPFVMGVIGDFSGQPVEALEELKKRRFVDVTPENFDGVLDSMKPHLAFTVANKLKPGAGSLGVDLHFHSMDDFEPEQVARQIGPMRDLLDLRTKLSDLRGSLQTNEQLDRALSEIVGNSDSLAKIRGELGKKDDAAPGDPK